MGVAANTPDGGSKELEDLIHQLEGRVVAKITVVNGKTGARSQMLSCDVDVRDIVEVMFEGVPPVEGEEEIFTYSFRDNQLEHDGKVDPEMANGNRKSNGPSFEDLEEAFGNELRRSEPTFEDYLLDINIRLEDLSIEEKSKAMKHDLDELLDLYDSLGFSEEEKKPGFFGKLFS